MFPHFRHERLKDPLGSRSLFSLPCPPETWRLLQMKNSITSNLLITWWLSSVNWFLWQAMWTLTLDFFPQEPCSVTFHDSIPKAWRSNSDFTKGEVCPLNSSQVILETWVGIIRGYKGMWAGLLSFHIEKEWLTREQKYSPEMFLQNITYSGLRSAVERWSLMWGYRKKFLDLNQTEREFSETSLFSERGLVHIMGPESTCMFCWPLRRLLAETLP